MPSTQLFSNNAAAKLGLPLAIDATTLEVQAGEGALFPVPAENQFFYLTLVDAENYIEIVRCTARDGDVMTVIRGQDGTAPRVFALGDVCELRITAGTLGRFTQADAPTSVTGAWQFFAAPLVPLVPPGAGSATSRQYVDELIDTHDHDGDTIGPVVLAEGSTAATPATSDDSNAVATTAFVRGLVSGLALYAAREQEVLAPTTTDWVTYLTYTVNTSSDTAVLRHDLEIDRESRTRFALCQGCEVQLVRGAVVVWTDVLGCTSEFVDGGDLPGTTVYDGVRATTSPRVSDAPGSVGDHEYTVRFRRTRADEPHETYMPRVHSCEVFVTQYAPA